jgi:hypothetical protein
LWFAIVALASALGCGGLAVGDGRDAAGADGRDATAAGDGGGDAGGGSAEAGATDAGVGSLTLWPVDCLVGGQIRPCAELGPQIGKAGVVWVFRGAELVVQKALAWDTATTVPNLPAGPYRLAASAADTPNIAVGVALLAGPYPSAAAVCTYASAWCDPVPVDVGAGTATTLGLTLYCSDSILDCQGL